MSNTIQKHIFLAAACVALNLGLGKIANVMQLPLFFDSVGTILAAAMLPWSLVAIVGAVTAFAASFLIHPAFLYYAGTQIVIGLIAVLAYSRGWFDSLPKALFSGAIIAIAATIISAPVTVLLFGGITSPGVSAVTAVLIATGQNIWTAVASGSIITNGMDKLISCALVWIILDRLPKRVSHQ